MSRWLKRHFIIGLKPHNYNNKSISEGCHVTIFNIQLKTNTWQLFTSKIDAKYEQGKRQGMEQGKGQKMEQGKRQGMEQSAR